MRHRRSNRIIEHPPISSSSKYFQRNSTRRNPERESSSSSFIHNGARSRASRSERASIYAHTHAYTHLHTRTVDGSHSTPHYFLARSVDQQKEAPLKRYIPPPSPSRRSSIFSPRFFCSSFPDGPLINSIHRRRFQLDRVARIRGDIPLLPPPAHLTAATFKVSNELGMIHGFAGLGRLLPGRNPARVLFVVVVVVGSIFGFDALFVPLVSLVFASLRGKFSRRL